MKTKQPIQPFLVGPLQVVNCRCCKKKIFGYMDWVCPDCLEEGNESLAKIMDPNYDSAAMNDTGQTVLAKLYCFPPLLSDA